MHIASPFAHFQVFYGISKLAIALQFTRFPLACVQRNSMATAQKRLTRPETWLGIHLKSECSSKRTKASAQHAHTQTRTDNNVFIQIDFLFLIGTRQFRPFHQYPSMHARSILFHYHLSSHDHMRGDADRQQINTVLMAECCGRAICALPPIRVRMQKAQQIHLKSAGTRAFSMATMNGLEDGCSIFG